MIYKGVTALTSVTILMVACSKSLPPITQVAPFSPPAASSSPAHPSSGKSQQPVAAQKPVAPENNPPGDIPDSTQYVSYHSKAGSFTVKVPSGWSRHQRSNSVTFSDKLNTIALSWSAMSSAPTVSSTRKTEVPQLQQTQLAFRLTSVKQAGLPGGKTVLITYEENSPPSRVTGKQYRLVVLRYEFFNKGSELVLTLSSPVGADNVDPWNTVSQSVKLG